MQSTPAGLIRLVILMTDVFDSAGALEFVNEYSGLAATTGYLVERGL